MQFDLLKLTEKYFYEDRLSMLKLSDKVKSKAIEKIREIKTSRDGSSKAEKYLHGFLVPFNNYIEEPILSFLTEYKEKLSLRISTILPQMKKYEDLECFNNLNDEFDFIIFFYNMKERNTSKLIDDFIYFMSSKLDKLNTLLINLKKNIMGTNLLLNIIIEKI